MSYQLIIKGCLRRARFTLDLDLDVDLTKPLGIMGATGAGKTTLLRVIAGLERDFSGLVQFCGEVWHDGDHSDLVPTHQRGLGVVFQDGRLLPGRTVESNLAFAQQRARNVDAVVSYDALTEALDLNHLLSESVEELSGGERQRVALARALLARPRLLLLDEPTAGMARADTNNTIDLLKQIKDERDITIAIIDFEHLHDSYTSSSVKSLDYCGVESGRQRRNND